MMIDKMGRELETMSEKIKDYKSIWGYTTGETVHLFPLFEYPNPDYTPTKLITNFREKSN